MVELVRHRQTKGAETDMSDLQPPRHISTLHNRCRLGPSTPTPLLKFGSEFSNDAGDLLNLLRGARSRLNSFNTSR